MRACFGTLISEFTILSSFLNCVQSLGSLDLHYLILKLSRSCIRFFSSDVIQGELRARTSIVLRGACLSRIDRTTFSLVTTYHLDWLNRIFILVPTLRGNIITTIFSIEFSKIPISYNVVTS